MYCLSIKSLIHVTYALAAAKQCIRHQWQHNTMNEHIKPSERGQKQRGVVKWTCPKS